METIANYVPRQSKQTVLFASGHVRIGRIWSATLRARSARNPIGATLGTERTSSERRPHVVWLIFVSLFFSVLISRLPYRLAFDNNKPSSSRHKTTHASQSRSFPLSLPLPFTFLSLMPLVSRPRATSNRHKPLPRGGRTLVLLPRFISPFMCFHSPHSFSITGTSEVAVTIQILSITDRWRACI
jgi:hypothetical protein